MKIKQYTIIILLLSISLLFYTNIQAEKIKNNNEELNLTDFFKKINEKIFIDEKTSFEQFVDNEFIQDFFTVDFNEKTLNIKKVNLLKTHHLVDNKYLLNVTKEVDSVLVNTYVIYDKNENKIYRFVDNEQIFFESYNNNKIENKDLIADMFIYFLSKNDKVNATKFLAKASDYDLFYEESKNKYKYVKKYALKNESDFIYQYLNEEKIYKLFVLYLDEQTNTFKINISNVNDFLYSIKDNFDKDMSTMINFVYLLNNNKKELKQNEVFKTFSDSNKEVLLNTKKTFYITNFNKKDDLFNFTIKESFKIGEDSYIKGIKLNGEQQEDNIYIDGELQYELFEDTIDSKFVVFIVILIATLIPVLLLYGYFVNSNTRPYQPYTPNNRTSTDSRYANYSQNTSIPKQNVSSIKDNVSDILNSKEESKEIKVEKDVEKLSIKENERQITFDKKDTKDTKDTKEKEQVNIESKRAIHFDD